MHQKESRPCVHCEPLIERHNRLTNLIFIHLGEFINVVVAILDKLSSPRAHSDLGGAFFHAFVGVFSKLGIVKFKPTIRRDEIQNRTLVLLDEAQKKGYTAHLVALFDKPTNIFRLNVRGKTLFFHVLPSLSFTESNSLDLSDKYKFKLFLETHGLPYYPGRNFYFARKAIGYGSKLGYPLVVKPRFGSLSRHTTVGIMNAADLKEAIRIVKQICGQFIVEKHIEGNNYRAIAVGGKVVACALREPPNVVGDGIRTIRELITTKNQNLFRGYHHQKNFTLKKIDINTRVTRLLEQKNYTLDSVPIRGDKIYLDTKVILSAGSDIHDVTDFMHKENIDLLEKASSLLGVSPVGFDLISSDISKPYYSTSFAIIEANTAPYIDMHHFPTYGEPRNVAAKLVDEIESLFIS